VAWLFDTSERLVAILDEDLVQLSAAGRRATHGDIRCIVFGHLTRMAVWNLRATWDRSLVTSKKIAAFRDCMIQFGDPEGFARMATAPEPRSDLPLFSQEATPPEEGFHRAVSF